MAVMRTNRLTSKTTPPKTRKMVPASDLEAQDASYKKYQEDVKSYGSKLDKYNKDEELYKKSPRSYANWGGIQGTRELNKAELADFNKAQDGTEYDWVRTGKDFKGNASNISGFHGGMKKPTAPKKSEPADWSAVQLDKMPTKKATIQAPKGKLRQAKPAAEKPVFEAPASTRSKTRTSAAMTGGGKSGLTRATNPKGSLGAAKVTTTVNKAGRGYNKEAKQFAAYANPTASGTYLNTASKPEIMRMRAESKGIQKEYRKEGNKEGAKMMRSEAKQLKTAGKFADKVYEKGGGKYFKGSMVDQYRTSK